MFTCAAKNHDFFTPFTPGTKHRPSREAVAECKCLDDEPVWVFEGGQKEGQPIAGCKEGFCKANSDCRPLTHHCSESFECVDSSCEEDTSDPNSKLSRWDKVGHVVQCHDGYFLSSELGPVNATRAECCNDEILRKRVWSWRGAKECREIKYAP